MSIMCIEFVNSNSPWYETHYHFKDGLGEKVWIEWFLKKWGFPIDLSAKGYEFKQLSDLRTLLTEAIDIIITGNVLPEKLLQKLNLYFSKANMHYDIKVQDKQYILALTTNKVNWDYICSEILVSFLRLISDMETTRIKRCENPSCRSVFYDSSKNQARKWCCNTCSSLIKVRRHRKNKKGE